MAGPTGDVPVVGRLERLKRKYHAIFNAMQQQHVVLEEVGLRQDKLYVRAQAPAPRTREILMNLAALIDPEHADLIADIRVGRPAESPTGGQETYTVQAGDTLAKLAEDYYGDPRQYLRIFEANRDRLSDPDSLRPGQQIIIPTD